MKTRKQVCHLAITVVMAAMLCIYMVSVFYINLSQRPSFYVTDMYADVLVSVKMWEQKTFLPENWIFSNQVYVLATPSLAAVLYGITGDAFWSMAAASCVMAVLVIVSFDWMLKAVFQDPAERLFGAVSFLAAVVFFGDTIETTNGWQLLFTMCSYYACYAINAFLAFGCYLRSNSKVSWIPVAGVCLVSFAMGIQSLRQTAVMACPLIAMELIQVLRRLWQRRPVLTRSFFVASAISVSNLAGAAVNHFLNINQMELFGQLGLINIRYLPDAVWSSIKEACALFVEPEPSMLHQAALLIFVILAAVLFLKTKSSANPAAKPLFALLLLSVLAIAGIDTVTTMAFRNIYYFMLYPLLVCLAVYVFADRHLVIKGAMMLLLCAVFCSTCLVHVIPACQWAHNSRYDIHYEISEDLLDNGYTTVFSAWNGCEKIAIASQGKIRAGFWEYGDEPFVPVPYLCEPDIYMADPEHTAYVFYGEEAVQIGLEEAGKMQVELIPLLEYPEKDIYIYTAPVNLMQVLPAQQQTLSPERS